MAVGGGKGKKPPIVKPGLLKRSPAAPCRQGTCSTGASACHVPSHSSLEMTSMIRIADDLLARKVRRRVATLPMTSLLCLRFCSRIVSGVARHGAEGGNINICPRDWVNAGVDDATAEERGDRKKDMDH